MKKYLSLRQQFLKAEALFNVKVMDANHSFFSCNSIDGENLANEIEILKKNMTSLIKAFDQFRRAVTENLEHLHGHEREMHGTLHKIMYDHQHFSMSHGGMGHHSKHSHHHHDHHGDSQEEEETKTDSYHDHHGDSQEEETKTDSYHHHHHGHHHSEHNHMNLFAFNGPRAHGGHRVFYGDEYEHAICRMMPNRAIPKENQQNVHGNVILWQHKNGGTLHVHVRVRGFNVSRHEDGHHPGANSHQHGFHVHSKGDLSDGCQSTGPLFNPTDEQHGGPSSPVRHVGGFGNIACDQFGVTNTILTNSAVSLIGPNSIVGKALVIHANPHDFGNSPDNPANLVNGNSGTRLSCCIIEKTEHHPVSVTNAQFKSRGHGHHGHH
ncbi:uncharacterized protein LOC106463399 [Limulus polyphemus]|uniref:Superoxide dismutase [Cu-Zn] n=1 Tax=Limulus polyphemus TaxID=6850 RepID=A0ABM1BBW3_LIMPO|nr:uncharacterized protein LOC106463399 [Limulus polyphemus]